jgi:hypothetical protein
VIASKRCVLRQSQRRLGARRRVLGLDGRGNYPVGGARLPQRPPEQTPNDVGTNDGDVVCNDSKLIRLGS